MGDLKQVSINFTREELLFLLDILANYSNYLTSHSNPYNENLEKINELCRRVISFIIEDEEDSN